MPLHLESHQNSVFLSKFFVLFSTHVTPCKELKLPVDLNVCFGRGTYNSQHSHWICWVFNRQPSIGYCSEVQCVVTYIFTAVRFMLLPDDQSVLVGRTIFRYGLSSVFRFQLVFSFAKQVPIRISYLGFGQRLQILAPMTSKAVLWHIFITFGLICARTVSTFSINYFVIGLSKKKKHSKNVKLFL